MLLVTSTTKEVGSEGEMDLPPIDLLICAYLGQKFAAKSRAGTSYDDQAKALGLRNKQSLLKLAGGKTVGMAILWELADAMTDGSIDALAAQAKRWWHDLPTAERSQVGAWALETERRRSRNVPDESAMAVAKGSRAGRIVSGAEMNRQAEDAARAAKTDAPHGQKRPSSSRIKR